MGPFRRSGAFIFRAITQKPSLLLILAAAAGALWIFVEVADEVLEGETRVLDRAIILALRTPGDPNDPLGPRWVEEMMRDFTALGGITILTIMVLAAAGYLLLADKRRTAVLLAVASIGGLLLTIALKYGFDRPRPDLVSHGSMVYTASFPSGHSMLSAVVYFTLGTLLASVHPNVRIKLYFLSVAFLLTVLVGISRVYLGVHWPTDVVAGWTAGLAWALWLWWFSLWMEKRQGTSEAR